MKDGESTVENEVAGVGRDELVSVVGARLLESSRKLIPVSR